MKFNFQTSLAKLMAREDITVIPTTHKTAYFDVKNRTLGIPNWKGLHELELELLIGHEIGHALYTDCVEFASALNSFREKRGVEYLGVFRDYINVVEDARIESLVKEKYPGMKKIFYFGYSRIANRDIFKVTQDNIESLNDIDYINAYFKFNGVFTFNPKRKPKIAPFIDKISKVVTFDDVVRVSYELFEAFLKKTTNDDASEPNQESNDPKEQSQQVLPDSEESSEASEESSEEETDPSESSEEKTGAGTDDGSVGEEKSESDSSSEESLEEKTGTEDSADEEKSEPAISFNDPETKENSSHSTVTTSSDSENNRPEELESQTAKTLNEFLEDSSDSRGLMIISNPIPNLDAIIYSHKNLINDMPEINSTIKNKDIVSKNIRDSVNQIKKVFEMRKKASEYNRTNTYKTGKLDTNKIHSYKYNDEIFKSFQSTNSGKNHGLIFFLDMSSSMHSCIKQVVEKMIELVIFCREAGIKYEVYGFSDNPLFDKNKGGPTFTTDNAIYYNFFSNNDLTLVELFTDTMTTLTFNKMIGIVRSQIGSTLDKGKYLRYLTLHSTPLDQTIMCLNKMIEKFRGRTNSQMVNVIFLTDGSSSDSLRLTDKDGNQTYIGANNDNCVLIDTLTKKTYDVGVAGRGYLKSEIITSITSIQLKMVKDRNPGVNIINFFLTSYLPFTRKAAGQYQKITQKQYNEFLYDNKKPVIVDNYNGFDRVFFINSRSVSGNTANKLKQATTDLEDIKEKFQGMQKNNKADKFLVTSFVDMIV